MFITDDCLDVSYWIENPTDIALITSPVGYGKTHYAINRLPKFLAEQTGRDISKVLMLVPTDSIRTQILEDPELCADRPSTEDICEGAFGESTAPFVYVDCFAKLGKLLSEGKQLRDFDLLILDEIDLLAKWSCFFDNYPIVWEWIASKSEMLVCGLTATPYFPLHLVGRLEFKGCERREFICIDKEELKPKYQARYLHIAASIKVNTFLEAFKDNFWGKTLVYVQSAKQCYELAKKYPNSGFIVSESNEYVPQGETENLGKLVDKQIYEGMTLRDYVVSTQHFPHDVQMLFTNDSCSVGVSIHDEDVNNVICATYDLDTIIQVQGRIRHDIGNLAICYTRYQPDEIDCYQWRFKSLDGSMKLNPLVKPYLEYCVEGNLECVCSDSESYFKELEPYAASSKVEFLDADRIRYRLSAEYHNGKFDYLAALGLSEECNEVWLTAKELTDIAKSLGVRKKSGRNVGGRQSLIDAVNASGDATITKVGQIMHNGKRSTWYIAKNGCNFLYRE